jgi:transposase-like protein
MAADGNETPGTSAKFEEAALAIARGVSVAATARQVELSTRQMHRWVRRPAFKARVREIRAGLFEQAYNRLASLSGDAVDRLRELLASKNEPIALGAAKALLASGCDLRESIELAEKVAELDRLLQEMKTNAAKTGRGTIEGGADPARGASPEGENTEAHGPDV